MSGILDVVKEKTQPKIDCIYLVKKPGLSTYARGRIMSINGQVAVVYLIDYCVSALININNIKVFPNIEKWKVAPLQ